MHSLDVIILRNAQAAGREYAHAINDNDSARADKIADAHGREVESAGTEYLTGRAFFLGYNRGRQEK